MNNLRVVGYTGLFACALPALGEPNPLNNVYFGEQHLHSAASPDAFAFGTRNTADDAYRFAKGESIKNHQSGKMIQKKKRPTTGEQ